MREGAEALPAAHTPSEPVAKVVEVEAAEPTRVEASALRRGPIDPAALSNRKVTVLADSVLLGAKGSVVRELAADGWEVDYRGQPAWMLHKAAADLEQAGQPVGSVVIVGLGYNSLWERNRARFDSWAAKFDREAEALISVLRELGAERIVWVMVREPTLDVLPREGLVGHNKYAWFFPYVNERLRALKTRQADLVLVDWAAVSDKPGITYDAIHLNSAGVRLMIDTIRSTTGL